MTRAPGAQVAGLHDGAPCNRAEERLVLTLTALTELHGDMRKERK